jgi:hypothetical protein
MPTQVLITTNNAFFGEEGFLRTDIRTLLTTLLGEDSDLYISFQKDNTSPVTIHVRVDDVIVTPGVPDMLAQAFIWGSRRHNQTCAFEFADLSDDAVIDGSQIEAAMVDVTKGVQEDVDRKAGGWY